MINGFEDFQKLGKENMDVAMKNFGSFNKDMQSLVADMADYSKKSFEDSAATFEKMAAAKSIDKATEIQSDFVKSSYEGFVAQATKVSEMYAGMAKDAYKPFEGLVAKVSK